MICCSYCQQIEQKGRNWKQNGRDWQLFVAEVIYLLFLCAVELYCCPKTIKNTAVSHTVTPADMSLYYTEDVDCRLFWVNPINTILERLTLQPNVLIRLRLKLMLESLVFAWKCPTFTK